jgi:hypothetical protein
MLLFQANALLDHNESAIMQPDKYWTSCVLLTGRYFILKYNMKKMNGWGKGAFPHATFRYMLIRTLIMFGSPGRSEADRVCGSLHAMRENAAGKVSVE